MSVNPFDEDEANKWPYDGCYNAYDLGIMHGSEDIGEMFRYRPGIYLNDEEWAEYKDGYSEGYGYD
jgi:hypothetical protein